MTDLLIIIGTLSFVFGLLCAMADWAIPRLILLRRRRRIIAARAPRLARMMSEEYRHDWHG